ncbi:MULTISPECIES: hypothetical protein [Paraliobacillus]|uniref:hypothetical protein n=1 Tax=Paraliobacillus TaxID=200903 RepID=UPI000DD376AF|nr:MULTISPECIES: hypothetical protein [Paraliobacillus]
MKITDPEKLKYIFRQAKATIEIEGNIISQESEKIIKAVLSGKMKREELIERHKINKHGSIVF